MALFSTAEEAAAFLDAPDFDPEARPPIAVGQPSREGDENLLDVIERPLPGMVKAQGGMSAEEAAAFLDAEDVPKAVPKPVPAPTPKPTAEPPLTTPEAVDGSDVTFEEDGPAFSFSGKVEEAPNGQMVPTSGQVVFDTRTPERFKQGVAEARAAGLLDEAQFDAIDARADDLMRLAKERQAFEERARKDARWKAALHGLGKGAAMGQGALSFGMAGAAAGGAVGLATGPFAPVASPVFGAVGGVTGAIAGGIMGGMAYDNVYDALARHYEEYDEVLRATKLAPAWDAGGQLAFAAAALPVSAVQGVKGLATVADAARRTGQAVAPAVLAQAGVAAGAGAATGAAGYAADSLVQGREMSPGGFAAAAGGGALMGGFFINNRRATDVDVFNIIQKQLRGKPITAAEQALADAVGPVARAKFAQMAAEGGVRTPGKLVDIEVPMTSVAGFRNRAGTVKMDIPYSVPKRLSAPASAGATEAPPMNGVAGGGAVGAVSGAGNVVPGGGAVARVPMVPDAVVVPQGGLAAGALMDRVHPVVTDIVAGHPVVEVPVEQLRLSKDVPNFKEEADETRGVVKGDELEGKYERLGTGAIVAWQRKGGGLEVITGRHRLDLARRSGEKTIPTQIVREDDGFTLQNALTLDAEANIRDGQGTIRDYANYFRHTEIGETEAMARGLLSRARQRAAFAIGKGASDALYDAFRNKVLPEGKAAAIAESAPRDETLQRVALARQRNMSPDELRGFVRAAAAAKVAAPMDVVQGDFFADDSAMLRIEEMSKAANARARELQEQVTAVRSAAKRPEAAAKLGVDVRDPEGIMRKVAELEQQAQAWREFYKHPALMAELGGGEPVGEPVVVAAEGSGGVQSVGNADKLPTVDSHGGGLFSEEEMPFNLAGEVDSVTPTAAETAEAERADRAKRDFERGQGDLFGGETKLAGGDVRQAGGGAVPGAGPRAAASGKVPDWVKGKAETKSGRGLVWRLENYGPGRRNVGFASIVDHVNKAVNLDMRRSTSQTSKKHPAHYNVVNRVVFTREGQSQINFHEAGHKLEAMIEGQDAGWFAAHGAELLAIAGRAESMASDPPNWMSKAEKDRYRMGEGLAEWMRLAVTNPAAVEASTIMGAAEAVVGKYWPKTMAGIRDAARAYERIGRMSAADRWMMFAAGGKSGPPTWQDYVGAMVRGRDAAARLVSQNAPARGVANRIMRMIRKHHEQMGLTKAEATNIMRDVRKAHLNPMLQAFASERIARPEAMRALDSSGEARGMRVFGADGNYKIFTRDTWKDRRARVPAGALHEYDAAAWAQETLTRWELGKMEYPGMRDGITPEVLREIVRDAEVSLRAQGVDFQKQFKLEEDYFHTLLKVKEYGGILAPGEADRISAARPTYRPLPKVYRSGRSGGGSGGLDVQKGVKAAHGSVDAYKSVDEVAVERTFETFESFYKVRARNAMYDRMRAVATDKRLPMEVRDLAGRQLVALKLPKELTATVSGEEIKKHVVAAINAQLKDVLGFGNFTEEQLNIDIPGLQVWRAGKPGDVNVMSSFRKGKLVFMQVGDPEVLAMFADDKSVSRVVKFWDWLATPMAQNMQRLITRNLVFGAVRNPMRDIISQLVLNPEKNAGIPLSSHWRGAVNKFNEKYPTVAQDGLLLSRMERGENDALNRLQHGKVAQWLLEGLYFHRSGTPAERAVGTVLNPANWLYPFFKIGDAVNAVTLGSTVAPYTEEIGREGAAVGVKMRGGTDEEAALRYWMAAGQFNEHSGSATLRAIMRPAVFMNPGLQGTRNAVNVLTDPDPAVRGRAWYNLLIKIPAIAAGAAGAAYLFMDGKDKEAERNRPLSDRMGHMNLGGFRVPFSFGPEGVLQSVVYNAMMDYVLDRPATQRDKAAWQLMQQAFDVGGPMQFFGPQISSWQEAQMNFSTFRQKPIVSPWLQNLPASEQTYATTPEFYNKLGRWADYSPAKLQYLVQQGIGRQLDDTIKLVDAIRGEKPIKEWADVPFVGRAFVRDPVGFGSQPMIEFQEIDGKLAALDARLRAAGWAGLKDPKFPIGAVKDENILALRNQLVYLEKLRTGAKLLGVQASFAKAAGMAGNADMERNMQRAMTLTATRVLAEDDEMVERIEAAMKMIENLPELSPQQKAAEYLERKY